MENARDTEDKRYNGTSLHRNHKMNTPVKRMIFFAMLLHNVCHKTSIFSEPPGTRCILWRRNKEEKCDVTLPWWQNFSISTIFLDRNGHLRCRTTEEKFGLPFCSLVQSSTGKSYLSMLSPYLRDHGLLRSRYYATMATWCNDFSPL